MKIINNGNGNNINNVCNNNGNNGINNNNVIMKKYGKCSNVMAY
jgi:hypothetical protein